MTALRSTKGILIGSVALGLTLAAALWFLAVSPQRSEASSLDSEIASVESQIATRRAELASTRKLHDAARAADLYRLTKALPGTADMPMLVFELDRLARRAGVTLASMAPAPSVRGTGFDVQPIAVIVEGRYGAITKFVSLSRGLVTVRKGKLQTSGRLLAIDAVEVAEHQRLKFPFVQATLLVNAFVYSGVPAPGETPVDDSPSTGSSQNVAAAGANP